MNNTKLLPFDLEVALKQPKRVVYRNGEKPLGWHYFDVEGLDMPIIDTQGETYTKDGKFRYDGGESNYDLFLLPEFTPEEGKWYWVQQNEFMGYEPIIYLRGSFRIHGIGFSVEEMYTIHPEPINPPE
jgi:hypothetical protein